MASAFERVGPFHIAKAKAPLAATTAPTKPLPVAFIFGWTDGKLQHVAKYASLYRSKGMDVVLFLSTNFDFPSYWTTWWKLRENGGAGVKALEQLGILAHVGKDSSTTKDNTKDAKSSSAHRPQHRHVLVHVLSNGGLLALHALDTFLRTRWHPLTLRTSGIILDSVPSAVLDFNKGIAALTTGIKNPLILFFAQRTLYLYFASLHIWNSIILGKKDYGRILDAREHLKDPKMLQGPRLYLYSKGDRFIDWEYVARYAQEMRDVGFVVYERVWEDSPHVQHFLRYPEEYRKIVHEFLEGGVVGDGVNLDMIPSRL
ncbi:Transmembrane protein 53 [Quaeritorhiza haematococci]|nr:Transmembrane protein 53 [Quaeritorhiza haematococci]